MILERSESTAHSTVNAKRRHLVGDTLLGVWNNLQNRCPKSLENCSLTRGYTAQIFVNFSCTPNSPFAPTDPTVQFRGRSTTTGPLSSNPTIRCPRQDSNLRTRFRKPMLYPLSYEGGTSARTSAESSARKSTPSLRRVPDATASGTIESVVKTKRVWRAGPR